MAEPGDHLSGLLPLLIEHRDMLQILACAAGTLAGGALVLFGYARRTNRFGRIGAEPAAFAALVMLGCVAYFGPLGSLDGDGGVHQAKIWYIADALRHGTLPDWTFLWFGGGVVGECYGPFYYVVFAVPMLLFGLSSKWSIVLILMACAALAAILIVRHLTPRYGFFAAAVTAGCYLFSPARAAEYWYDGTPHRLVIDFICVAYILYLWRHLATAAVYRIGLFLGLASASCVYFHLQFGGIAALLLFALTALVITFDRGFAPSRAVGAIAAALVVFLPTVGLHYLYYFMVKPDLVADADSLQFMLAPMKMWGVNLAAESMWNWTAATWDVHYVGLVPLVLSTMAVFVVPRSDRFAAITGVFVVLLYAATPLVPRINVFIPVFFVPAVAAMVHWLAARHRTVTAIPLSRLGAVLALVTVVDLYPSNFQLPYRPGTGDRPVAETLAAIGPTRGRVAVVSPDRLIPNMSADRFTGVAQVASPSTFGPTFQLGTKMLGFAAVLTRQAWEEFDRIGTITPHLMDYFALLDVSDVLVTRRDQEVVRLPVPHYRAAWRIERFICDPAASPLTAMNWDDMRALGLGEVQAATAADAEITVDAARGVVRGVRLDCSTLEASADPGPAPAAADQVTDPLYDHGMTTAAFTVDAAAGGLFLLPFGYVGDLRVVRDTEPLATHRTSNWMTVVALPAGHSVIRITAPLRQAWSRRMMDVVFVVILGAAMVRSFGAGWMRGGKVLPQAGAGG